MASDLPDVVERFVADVSEYVREVERAAREADRFGDQQSEAAERARRMGHVAQEAAERAARAQRAAAQEAERLAEGQGDAERAARAAARAQRELERAEMAQSRAARAAARAADEQEEQYRQLAREAARSAAAQRLAMMRAAGQTREHNELLRRLTEEFGNFGREGDRAFTEMESGARRAGRAMSVMLRQVPMQFQAALAVLPLIASIAGGVTALAFGAAVSAIAIKAASQAEAVKQAFGGLTDHVKSELRKWARPWEDTLVHMAGTFRKTFDKFQPTVQRLFADIAPVVQEFVDQAADSLKHFEPTIRKWGAAFRAVLSEIGPRMDTIMHNLAAGLSSIADAIADNPEALAQFAEDLSTIARAAAWVISILTRLSALNKIFPTGIQMVGKYKDLWDKLKGSTDEATQAQQRNAQAQEQAAVKSGSTSAAYQRQQQIMQLAGMSADQLKNALDRLAGKELTAREAAAQYGQSILQMNAALKENGRAHGFTTAKGIANEQALAGMTRAAHANITAMKSNGASQKDVAKAIENARQKTITYARQMGYTQKEAQELADKLYGVRNQANKIPAKKKIKVDAETQPAKSKIQGLIDWARGVGATIRGWFSAGGYVGYASGGMVAAMQRASVMARRFPTGGAVFGPGTSTSDSIPAWLSNGEFVINAAATKRFRPLLEIINGLGNGAAGTPARPAPMPSPVMARPSGGGTIVQVTEQHFHIAGTVLAERQLLDLVQTGAARRNVRNPGLAQFGAR